MNKGVLFQKGHKINNGRVHTKEQNKNKSEEVRRQWADGRRKPGWKASEEIKRKMSESHKGKAPYKITDEIRKNKSIGMKKAWKDGKFTKERNEKIRKKTIERVNNGTHNFWKGGITDSPYSTDWTKTLKRSIRERDHYICQICGKNQEDIAFCVHHIDYNKLNCNPENLITLCKACHQKTNFNREHWKKILFKN